MISYKKNYILIYFWQSLSILLGFASLFVVMPYLSQDKVLFGIYSVCTSLTIFFSYADLGFISSGTKYAAEYFVQGDKEKEIRIIGFTAFIMLATFLLMAICFLVLSIYPRLLIPELMAGSDNFDIARSLLSILAISCPIIIGQRILNMIYSIRVEDYKFQRLLVIGSLLKIGSIFFFFVDGNYQIVEYFAFLQIVNLAIVLLACHQVKKYDYSASKLLKAMHFDRIMFNRVKSLTGTSLVMTISWVFYYELDQIAISNILGIEAVALYGIALSMLTFVRTYLSLLYSPYTSRYNHYVGNADIEGLMKFVNKMVVLFTPLVLLPILVLSLLAEPLIISWVGEAYTSSALLLSILVSCFAFNSVKAPIDSYFVATEKISMLLKYSILQPILYWIGIILTINYLGLISFALLKLVIPFVITIVYWFFIRREFQLNHIRFITISELLKTIVVPIFVVIILCLVANEYMIFEHTKHALCINIVIMGGIVLIAFSVSLLFNKQLAQVVFSYIKWHD